MIIVYETCVCGHDNDKYAAGRGRCRRCARCGRYRPAEPTTAQEPPGHTDIRVTLGYADVEAVDETGPAAIPSATHSPEPAPVVPASQKPLAVYASWLCEACGTYGPSPTACCRRTPIPVTVTITRRETR